MPGYLGKSKRAFLIIAGSAALGLGFLGAFLPVLPTTPFLLLSAYCYLRSSKRLYNWLINHPFFGAYVANYLKHRAITRSTRFGTLFFLWLTLIVSILVAANWHLTIFLLAVGIGVSIHLCTLKTLEKNRSGSLVVKSRSRKEPVELP